MPGIAMPGALTPTALASVAVMWFVAVAIPGPNFLVVARTAAARSRGAALAVVAGIGLGSACWSLAGLFGLHALFAAAPAVYAGLKLAGAFYLMFLGGRILLASRGSASPPPVRGASGFPLGLLTSLSNPKSALLVAGLFAAVMPQGASLPLGLATVAEMVTISVFWYAAVACLVSTAGMAAAFLRLRRWIDRLAGVVFMGFGARLVLERS